MLQPRLMLRLVERERWGRRPWTEQVTAGIAVGGGGDDSPAGDRRGRYLPRAFETAAAGADSRLCSSSQSLQFTVDPTDEEREYKGVGAVIAAMVNDVVVEIVGDEELL
jgi:hypothetical protein